MFFESTIKRAIEAAGPRFTQTTLTLRGVSLSMFSGAGTIDGLALGNPAGCRTEFAIRVDRAEVSVHPASILADKLHVRHLRLLAPEVNLEGGLYKNNLSQILSNLKRSTAANPDQAHHAGSIKKLQVDEFSVTGGKLHLTPVIAGGSTLSIVLPDIRFTDLGIGAAGLTPAELAERLASELCQCAISAAARMAGWKE